MLDNGPAQQATHENATTDALNLVKQSFEQHLNQYHSLSSEVVGFQDYDFLGWSIRQPMDINNVFNNKFDRNFHPSLLSAIQDLKSEEIKKDTLHKALLQKYLGIDIDDLEAQQLEPISESNAFNSVPGNDAEDSFLHLYFLQPFRLFNIKPDNRKNIRENTNNGNREWLWFSHPDTDMAPTFRAIIQLYIVSSILEDYATPNNEYRSDEVEASLEKLEGLQDILIGRINNGLDTAFNAASLEDITAPLDQRIRGTRDGVLRSAATLNRLMPNFLDIASFYPVGRLMFGQPRLPSHQLLAESEVRRETNATLRNLKYAFYWLYAHSNLSTSLYWIRTCLGFLATMFRELKLYITEPNRGFRNLFNASLYALPGAFLLAASPLLIIFPWIYGITSIPFSLLRSFILRGPFNSLRDYKILKGLDVLELAKDSFLFFWYIVPMLNVMLAATTVFIPAEVLLTGTIVSFVLLASLYLGIFQTPYYGWANDLWALASTNFFRFSGSSLVMGMGVYLGVGLAGRQIYPWLPEIPEVGRRLLNNVSHSLLSLLTNVVRPGNTVINDVGMIIPIELQEKAEIIPKINLIQLNENDEAERDQLERRLGQLNQAFNLSAEQKQQIRDCMKNIILTDASTTNSVQAAMAQARVILNNSITQDKFEEVRHLISLLPEEQRQGLSDNQALQVATAMKRNFMPSFKLAQALQQQHLINQASPEIRQTLEAALSFAPAM